MSLEQKMLLLDFINHLEQGRTGKREMGSCEHLGNKQVNNFTLSSSALFQIWRIRQRRAGPIKEQRRDDSRRSFCIPKTTRWASGSKEAAADEEK